MAVYTRTRSESSTTSTTCRSVKTVVLSRARHIYNLVNVDELIPEMVTPSCCFLTASELEKLHRASGDLKKARQLLVFLKAKSASAARQFIACLLLEPEHRGHQELARELMGSISYMERQRVMKIVDGVRAERRFGDIDSDAVMHTNSGSVEKPLPPIELQGPLKGEKYSQLDERLWLYLQKSQYDLFYKLTGRMQARTDMPDYQIVGMWFDSVAYIHTDKDHKKCIRKLLEPALNLCKSSRVINKNILGGRLHQRMSQVLLMLGDKSRAVEHFSKAECLLRFVGRGYDKVQIFLRNAKLQSATVPHNKQMVEAMYNSALDNILDNEPFAFSCLPSTYISKAAFHLGMSFGTKPLPTAELPKIPEQDIDKARKSIRALSLHKIQLFSMRECELDLVSAELLRLERDGSALEAFRSVKKRSGDDNLNNLVAIAEQRICYLESEARNNAVIDELLAGLP